MTSALVVSKDAFFWLEISTGIIIGWMMGVLNINSIEIMISFLGHASESWLSNI